MSTDDGLRLIITGPSDTHAARVAEVVFLALTGGILLLPFLPILRPAGGGNNHGAGADADADWREGGNRECSIPAADAGPRCPR